NVIRLLKLEGYEIDFAINGKVGLERARSVHPDVIITDVGMPEMDGFEMLEAIRADRDLSATSVMMLTALDDRASMRRGMTSGAEKLSSREVAELLTEYFDRVCEPVLKNGGKHLRFIGDGLMAVFSDTMSGSSPLPAARRAISAALGMTLSTHDFRSWLAWRF